MLGRMLGAVRFDVDTYEDVEDDRSATWQAMAVVVIVSIFSGIGLLLASEEATALDFVVGIVRGIGGWALWALVTWLVGGFLLKTPDTVADWGQLARTTGFAQTPGVFNVFIFIPAVGGLIALLAFIWQFACMVVAVRQSLDFTSTWRAFFVILISVIPWLILFVLFAALLGVTADIAS